MRIARNHHQIAGYAAGIAAGVSYGLNPLFGKPLIEGGVGVLTLLFFRYLISSILLAGWMFLRRESFRVSWRELRLLVLLGVLFSFSSIFLFESYKYIPSGLATTVVYLYPVFVAVTMLFFHVRPTWQVWLSIFATLVGVVLLCLPGGSVTLNGIGMLLAALSALTYAFYLVIVNRAGRLHHVSEHTLTFYALATGTVVFLSLYLVHHDAPFLQGIDSLEAVSNLLGLAIFPTMVSLLTLAIATRLIGPTKTAVLGVFEPVTAILVGTVIFAETLTANILLGLVLCIAAVLFMILTEKRPVKSNGAGDAGSKDKNISL